MIWTGTIVMICLTIAALAQTGLLDEPKDYHPMGYMIEKGRAQ